VFSAILFIPVFAQRLQETQRSNENSLRLASSVSLHSGYSKPTYHRLLSCGKKKKMCIGISMPDNWQLYKNRFCCLSLKFSSRRDVGLIPVGLWQQFPTGCMQLPAF